MERLMRNSRLNSKLAAVALVAFMGSFMAPKSVHADKHVGFKTSATISMDAIDHSAWDSLLQKYVNNSGMVNYAAWRKSPQSMSALNGYLNELSKAAPQGKASRPAKLAYWINAYNAVTIHGILDVYPTSSIRKHTPKVFGFNIWEDLHLYVGQKKYNLDSIEHKVLRKMGEPRIHFAIVCASIGCPRLMNKAFTKSNLSGMLNQNAKHFFSQNRHFKYDAAKGKFHLSEILKWFKDDFGDNKSARLKAIAPYLPSEAARNAANSGQVDIGYQKYNWKLNKQ